MSLRLVEATVPQNSMDGLAEAVGSLETRGFWTSGGPKGIVTVRILVEATHTESVTDLLIQRYGKEDGFRILLLPVEATYPEEPEQAAQIQNDRTKTKKGPPKRISREELYQDLEDSSKISTIYLATTSLSTIVAAVGLIRGDVAIIIGAMVIAPLLGPNIALSLAWTLGDVDLAARSLKTVAVGLIVTFAISVVLGLVLQVDPTIDELRSRSSVTFSDVALALAAGSAGSLAYTTGLPAALIGVMVAIALLPPLVATGLLAGSGYTAQALGALLLVITNVTCLNLAAVATFLAQRVRPRTWWEAKKAKRATRVAVGSWLGMLALLMVLMIILRT
jgi:uncharacterized hydrophobic protein (TIGR00341 family)